METIYVLVYAILIKLTIFPGTNAEFSMYYTDIGSGKLYHRRENIGSSSAQVKGDALLKPGKTPLSPVGLSYDQENDMLYWSEVGSRKILRMHPNGSNYQLLFSGILSEGLAWEPIGRLLFWTDLSRKSVGVCRPDYDINMTIIKTGLDKPRDVETYSEKGWLFITDWGSKPKVEQMTMCGSNRVTIAGNTKETTVYWPNGLTIDKVEEKLYYADARLDKMMRYDFSTKKTQLILKYGQGTYLIHPFGLTLHQEEIYWTDWSRKSIYKVNKRYGNGVTLVKGGLVKPGDIHAYDDSSEQEYQRIYKYAYPTTKCDKTCNRKFTSDIKLPNCPSGYKAIRDSIGCHRCIYPTGVVTGLRCLCTSWSSCVHRIEQQSPCNIYKSYLHFGVRECVKTIKPGYCDATLMQSCTRSNLSCAADQDCSGKLKCCRTKCGNICTIPIETKPITHPCRMEATSCQMCLPMPNNTHKCICPIGMVLDADNKTCSYIGAPCRTRKVCQNGGICNITNTGYQCNCKYGYTGRRCEIRLQCLNNPCQNGGVCKEVSGDYICNCTEFFVGKNCTRPRPCERNICQNNATCHLTSTGEKKCNCLKGFVGSRCKKVASCLSNPCKNNGTCQNGPGISYNCTCEVGYIGDQCQHTDFCAASNPCRNGGACSNINEGYKCNCTHGYAGDQCETVLRCPSKPCYNGGTCVEKSGNYLCRCPKYFVGRNCTTPQPCEDNVCQNNATCHLTSTGEKKCNCLKGFVGSRCETTVSCQNNPCKNNGTCQNGPDQTYICACKGGFIGDQCQHIDFCAASNPCRNSGVCSNIKGGYKCNCTHGYSGHQCETVLRCPSKPCYNGGTCVEKSGDYLCRCPKYFVGRNCTTPQPCEDNVCQNNATCHLTSTGKTKCNCLEGFVGSRCETIASCKGNPCKNNGTCRNGFEESYKCTCKAGFIGDQCQNIDYCVASNPCRNGAVCSNRNGGYKCNCKNGYTGLQCETILRCSSNPCRNGGVCVEKSGDYECICPKYFIGRNCSIPKPCKVNICHNNASCHMTRTGDKCICSKEFVGTRCEMWKACQSNPCKNNGVCLRGFGSSYSCFCKDGFVGKRCENIDFCSPRNPCQNGGSCLHVDGGFKCRCQLGYDGSRCEIPPKCLSKPCQNGGVCVDEAGGYICKCRPYYVGRNCEKPKPCVTNICHNNATCYMTATGGQKCSCVSGFTGTLCEACQRNPCGHNGVCYGGSDLSYKCACKVGYFGKRCENIDFCAPANPCRNGGSCSNQEGGKCSCTSGYRGKYCELDACEKHLCRNKGYCDGEKASSCTCPDYFVGRYCTVNTGDNLMVMKLKFEKGTEATANAFRDAVAKVITSYCRKQPCIGAESSQESERKISSQSAFNAQDIIVTKGYPRLLHNTTYEIEFTVLLPANNSHKSKRRLLPQAKIKEAIQVMKSTLEHNLKSAIIWTQKRTGNELVEKSIISILIGTTISLASTVFIVCILLLCCCNRKDNSAARDAVASSHFNEGLEEEEDDGLLVVRLRGPNTRPPSYESRNNSTL